MNQVPQEHQNHSLTDTIIFSVTLVTLTAYKGLKGVVLLTVQLWPLLCQVLLVKYWSDEALFSGCTGHLWQLLGQGEQYSLM
jgi:hypothetical protein